MKSNNFFSVLQHKNPFLSIVGWLNVGLLLIFLGLYSFDTRTILGISPWIKPIKFSVSIVVYLWTMVLVLDCLKGVSKKVKTYSFWIGWAMVIEIALITLQSARGTTSHFNIVHTLDMIIFNVMGVFILINTIVLIMITIDYFRLSVKLSPEMLWAIRLGLILLLLASFEAGFMLGLNKHTVGAADGSKGLPLLNWSTRFGDLRIAHFVGMHAIQLLPLLVLFNQKLNIFKNPKSKKQWL